MAPRRVKPKRDPAPAPTPSDAERQARLDDAAAAPAAGVDGPRKRRTRAEIARDERDAQVAALSDSGSDVIAQFLHSLSVRDAKVFGLDPVSVDFFLPISRNYAKVLNYFVPQNKPIYMVATAALFQTFSMMKARADLIDAKRPPKSPTPAGPGPTKPGKQGEPDSRQTGHGQEFPSATPPITIGP